MTQQYVDLQQQLTELRSEAAAYTRLFERAQSMKDMITIQQALTKVNAEMQNLTQQAHQLRQTVALASVDVTLTNLRAAGRGTPSPVVQALEQSMGVLGSSALALLDVVAWLVP
ncbi:hypothetical protein GCM10010885_08520 [Alicyclobacillus cellulosilyticus]|uniref:DUF4349 domain-containing protein n=1 Tax=Alicyclobacillus cellulosilyticus TaxID=1003997 RepID=A0A917NJ47_9BACL|nr:DUF4349 domain-containing protein [Alicyclobacillus cellulosilyticus]GGJ01612.1 hypothetical protein GCM10010885_08520 [Alicyclobacillus cellulosilyticus]